LASHARKKKMWTHFSAFKVWNNITEAEVAELDQSSRQYAEQ
jgi:hypothetical protein